MPEPRDPPAPPPGIDTLPTAPLAEVRSRSARSGLLQLASQAAQLAILVAAGMILARLLTPSDFGLVAMVGVVTGFVESIRHFGLSQAAVHRDELSPDEADALFWRSLQLTGIAVLAMSAAAPLLARFYGEPRLIAITLALALAVGVRGLTAVHEALLMRRIRFLGLVVAELGALLASVGTGITLALLGAGYWALVAQTLVLATVHTAALWTGVRWRPGRYARSRSGADLFAYGADVTRFNMLAYVGRNADRVVVGFFEGARSLGFYDAAYRWSLYPVQQIYTPLTGVALAGLARVRADADAYRRACRIGLLPVFSVVVPALAFLTVQAHRFIPVLLGDQWEPAIPLFAILCVGAIASIAIKVLRWIFLAEGRTARQLRWGLVFMPVMVVAVVAGAPWGPIGVACAYTAGSWIMVPSAVSACLEESAFRPRDFYAVALRPTAASLVAAGVTLALDRSLDLADTGAAGAGALGVFGLGFLAVYAAVWVALPGGFVRARESASLLGHAFPRR